MVNIINMLKINGALFPYLEFPVMIKIFTDITSAAIFHNTCCFYVVVVVFSLRKHAAIFYSSTRQLCCYKSNMVRANHKSIKWILTFR